MSTPTTKDDKQVLAALEIRQIAENLKTFDKELGEAIDIISDPDSCSKSKRLDAAKSMRSFRRSIESASSQLFKDIKVLDPIPSLDYVHSRQKNKQQTFQLMVVCELSVGVMEIWPKLQPLPKIAILKNTSSFKLLQTNRDNEKSRNQIKHCGWLCKKWTSWK